MYLVRFLSSIFYVLRQRHVYSGNSHWYYLFLCGPTVRLVVLSGTVTVALCQVCGIIMIIPDQEIISRCGKTLYCTLIVSSYIYSCVWMSQWLVNLIMKRRAPSVVLSINPFKPEFTIVIFIHYKLWIAVAIHWLVVDEDDLKWVKK